MQTLTRNIVLIVALVLASCSITTPPRQEPKSLAAKSTAINHQLSVSQSHLDGALPNPHRTTGAKILRSIHFTRYDNGSFETSYVLDQPRAIEVLMSALHSAKIGSARFVPFGRYPHGAYVFLVDTNNMARFCLWFPDLVEPQAIKVFHASGTSGRFVAGEVVEELRDGHYLLFARSLSETVSWLNETPK